MKAYETREMSLSLPRIGLCNIYAESILTCVKNRLCLHKLVFLSSISFLFYFCRPLFLAEQVTFAAFASDIQRDNVADIALRVFGCDRETACRNSGDTPRTGNRRFGWIETAPQKGRRNNVIVIDSKAAACATPVPSLLG